MELTGKAKEDFEKWYELQDWYDLTIENNGNGIYNIFDYIPDSMKYGVLVDWFVSVGIIIRNMHNEFRITDCNNDYNEYKSEFHLDKNPLKCQGFINTAAIEKANEIYNKQHK